jgi:hypothetical protein
MSASVLHVMFNHTAAGTLQDVLKSSGRTDEIACLNEDYSAGPLTVGADARAKWFEEETGFVGWQEIIEANEASLTRAVSCERKAIAWVSRRCASSYCGFLEWLSCRSGEACEVVDVTDYVSTVLWSGNPSPPRLVLSVGTLTPQEFSALLEQQKPLQPADREHFLTLWKKLRRENAPFRVIVESELVSAPIDFFDETILSGVGTEWVPALRVLSRTFRWFLDQDVFQGEPNLLFGRILALAKAGKLELRGDTSHMGDCEVRLPSE